MLGTENTKEFTLQQDNSPLKKLLYEHLNNVVLNFTEF